jgi:hypothetical protein
MYVVVFQEKVTSVTKCYSLTSLLEVGRVQCVEAGKSSGLTKPPRKDWVKEKGVWCSTRSGTV